MDGTTDSRNVAVQEFIINVENVADTPPIFVSAPPVTRLPESSKIGDFVCNIVADNVSLNEEAYCASPEYLST